MAIAFDASSKGTAGTATFTHTCTGLDLLLIVAIYDRNSNVTSVTYNGVSMSLLTSRLDNQFNTVYMYYLVNPATGSNTISVSKSSGTDYIVLAESFTGCAQTGIPDSSNAGDVGSSPLTLSTSVVASNCWLVMAGIEESNIVASPFTNKTDRQVGSFSPSNSYGICISDTNGTVGTGSQSVTFSKGGGGTLFVCGGIVASIAPVPPAASLLKEDGFYLLQENGGNILLDTGGVILPTTAINNSLMLTGVGV